MYNKYVYLEPMGGFSDMLSGVLWAINYSKSLKRKLLLNTMNSNYLFNFSDYFDLIDDNIIYDFNEIKKIFEKKNLSIYPNYLSTYIDDIVNCGVYAKHFTWTPNGWRHRDSNILMNYPSSCVEDIIIVIKNGGGNGYNMFQQIHIKPNIIEYCINNYLKLEKPYLGIHVRNTDIKSNYFILYESNKELFNKYKCIYIATDDKDCITYLKSKNLNVYNFTTFPDDNYYNLHNNFCIPNSEKIKQLISDIYIITMCDKFLTNSRGGFNNILRCCHNNSNIINKFKSVL